MSVTLGVRPAGTRWWPAGLAWAPWMLTLLGLAATAWFDHLLDQAGRPELVQLTAGGGVTVVLAAVSAATAGAIELLAIKGALLDQRQPISAQALQQLKRFLLDAGTSPLFGANPALARRAARQLQWSFTGRPEPN
jgi:hypothetical protein